MVLFGSDLDLVWMHDVPFADEFCVWLPVSFFGFVGRGFLVGCLRWWGLL